MITLLSQEHILGNSSAIIYQNGRNIYKIISNNNAKFDNQSHNFARFSAFPIQYGKFHKRVIVKAISGPKASNKMNDTDDGKSDIYSTTMSEAMGAVLTYRHELGMNYNFIRPDLIVGSCLQKPEDVDKLRNIGVRTIFCLQQNPDLQYFGVDINAIQRYAQKYLDIEHIRAEIRDFDGFDLRMRLPAVASILHKAINRNGGIAYIHCTAGMGRAPAVALAYMYWVQGYKLNEAYRLLLSKRSCCPKLDAIKDATADILTGLKKKVVMFKWADSSPTMVEISGLDVGWGPRIPLKFNKEDGSWTVERELPEGCFEYKYVVDGKWVCNEDEPMTSPNKDGHVNNYVLVSHDDPNSEDAKLRKRLTGDDPDLNTYERLQIRQYLEQASE